MSDAPEEVPTREGYDRWSRVYDDYDNPLILLEEPRVRVRIGDVAGLTVVDVGCGTGRHTLWMAQSGARVTGIDFSEGMLSVLRDKLDGGAVELMQHDLSTGIPLSDASCDLAISCLVLEHVPDLRHIVAEMARVVRPSGRIVISDFHPELVRRGYHARFREAEGAPKLQIRGASHTVSDYVMAVADAGLKIEHISEHPMTQELAERSRSARKWIGEPLLLLLELSRSA